MLLISENLDYNFFSLKVFPATLGLCKTCEEIVGKNEVYHRNDSMKAKSFAPPKPGYTNKDDKVVFLGLKETSDFAGTILLAATLLSISASSGLRFINFR